MNNKNTVSALLSSGFKPKNNAKMRIKMALGQKAKTPVRLQWALVLGGILLLIGLSVYKKNTEIRYLGPNAVYSLSSDDLAGQNFGESGPRGLESNPGYIHFQ